MENEKQSWFKKHADTIAILGAFVLCFWTLNEKITVIEKDVAVIKTVMMMNNIMPKELCKNFQEENKK